MAPEGTLHLVGLGHGPRGMTVDALEVLRSCTNVLLERYTSPAGEQQRQRWEALIGRPIVVLSREEVERADVILHQARKGPTALCTAGDPLVATTHQELRLSALEAGVAVHYWPAPSVQTIVPSLLGLQQYKFGRTITLPYPAPSFSPTSPLEQAQGNIAAGLHTLVLLDLHEQEGTTMRAEQGVAQLRSMAQRLPGDPLPATTLIAAVARAGWPDSALAVGTQEQWEQGAIASLGETPHALVLLGPLHFQERRAIDRWRAR